MMCAQAQLRRISPYVWEVAPSAAPHMRVPARLYADEELLKSISGDRTIEQLVNVTSLPGIVKHALAMPDAHQGYGFPIGGVAATALPDGAISPGGVGYDINCGVRVLTTDLDAEDVRAQIDAVMDGLVNAVPTGVGSGAAHAVRPGELEDLLTTGSAWAVGKGLGTRDDLDHTEDRGCMDAANPSMVSKRALERGRDQIGTLGAGNHFIEVDAITEVFSPEAADALGLARGRACVWIHCGSRGFGHQVCSDAVRTLQEAMGNYASDVPDRELACVPWSSPQGQQYFAAMACAANYAWANRQAITHRVRETFRSVFGAHAGPMRMVYDVCHNIAKVETHMVSGEERRLCVHRKGATRAFGPGAPALEASGLPSEIVALGQPVLIPGDMRSGSYVLLGTDEAMAATFGSTCHGAGRTLSRSKARREVRGEALRDDLAAAGITVRAGSMRGFSEEGPHAYKDVDTVVGVVEQAGLGRLVARTRPLGVIKG